MSYEVRFTKEAKKDIDKLTPKLKQKLKTLVQDTISVNPYAGKAGRRSCWFLLCSLESSRQNCLHN
jgi:mRNA-degrading endonuclease RelE of RelBE toxin-antitoxin system